MFTQRPCGNQIMGIQAIVTTQRAFFESGVTRPLEWRQAQLHALLTALEKHESALLDALHLDLGKPPAEAWISEIAFLRMEIRHTLRHLKKWSQPRRVGLPIFVWPARGHLQPEPRGTALIIGPWNYPLQLLLAPAVAALAAGNTVVLKPSELASHTATALAHLIQDTFSPEIVTVHQGAHEATLTLIDLKPDIIFFTGGSQGAAAVLAAAAPHLIPVVLELGGKSPAIVTRSAPLASTARRVVWGKFMNAGQTCIAPDHVWVHRSIASDFRKELIQAIRAFYGEQPEQSPDYGRICHLRHVQRLEAMIQDADILHGGITNQNGRYVSPTVLGQPTPGSRLAKEEIFGPLLPLLEFSHIDEVVEAHRGGPVPLAMYVFTRDHEEEQQLIAGIRSAGVCVNDTITHILPPQLPFGGLGQSGMGAYHGKAGFDTFTHLRPILRCFFPAENHLRYPPQKLALPRLKRMMRWSGLG
jgi:aldehyde dehydrogenase (NAD+)